MKSLFNIFEGIGLAGFGVGLIAGTLAQNILPEVPVIVVGGILIAVGLSQLK